MLTLNEWKELAGLVYVGFAVALVVMYVFDIVRKHFKKKITKKVQPKDDYKMFYHYFVKSNFKKQEFIGANKCREIELIRLFN